MLAHEALDLIDTYGGNSARWPSFKWSAVESVARTNPEVKAALKEARDLDKQLSKWKEDEDGAEVPEDDGTPDVIEASGELDAEGFDPINVGDMKDIGGMLADIIMGLVSQEFSDEEYVVYTRDFDKIAPVEIQDGVNVDKLEERVRKVSSVVQKDLQRVITARSLSTMQPGLRRGRLNPSALHRMEVDDDRVFRRKIESTSKDVAVSLLMDMSGSMNGAGKYQIAIESAWCFAEVLDRLGIKNEVLGFTTRKDLSPHAHYYTSTGVKSKPMPPDYFEGVKEFAKQIGKAEWQIRKLPLHIPIFKTFQERFGIDQKRRLTTAYGHKWAQHNLCENIDGESVLIAAQRLAAQKASRKLLIVFSDGNPAGDVGGYILNTHLKKAVKDIEAEGIETIGVGILSDSTKRFYPKSFRVDNLGELPAKVVSELKAFLTR